MLQGSRMSSRQPNTYPHPPIPAARLFFVFLCFFGVFFHLGKTWSRGWGWTCLVPVLDHQGREAVLRGEGQEDPEVAYGLEYELHISGIILTHKQQFSSSIHLSFSYKVYRILRSQSPRWIHRTGGVLDTASRWPRQRPTRQWHRGEGVLVRNLGS